MALLAEIVLVFIEKMSTYLPWVKKNISSTGTQ